MRAYPLFVGIVGIVVASISFFTTLWLLEPKGEPTTLAGSPVIDDDSLDKAARAAGLQPSADVQGNADAVSRSSASEVKVMGWAADVRGDGAPLTILAYSKGVLAARALTEGERPNVTTYLNKQPGEPPVRNVIFDMPLACTPGQKIVLVAVTRTNKYAPIYNYSPGNHLTCP